MAELRRTLAPLEKMFGCKLWDDSRIKTGDVWLKEIKTYLAQAKIAILLVSLDFVASDFIQEHELPILLSRQKKGGRSGKGVDPVLTCKINKLHAARTAFPDKLGERRCFCRNRVSRCCIRPSNPMNSGRDIGQYQTYTQVAILPLLVGPVVDFKAYGTERFTVCEPYWNVRSKSWTRRSATTGT